MSSVSPSVRSRGDSAGGPRAAGNPVARFDPVARCSARPILLLCLLIAVLLPLRVSAQAVTITAAPASVFQGQPVTLTTTVQIGGPEGPYVSTHTDSATPAATTTYTATVAGVTASVTVTVTPPPPPPAAQWVAICNVTGNSTTLASSCGNGPTVPSARGFNWRLPFDTVNGEALLFDSDSSVDAIYSTALWGYSARTHTFTPRVQQAVSDNASACGLNGPPGSTLPLLAGHPLGFMAFDSVRHAWYATAGLCQGYTNAFTSVYDAGTRTMRAPLATWALSPSCDGTFTCGSISWDSGMAFVAGYGKTITCCNGGGYFHLRIEEFDGARFSDVSNLQAGADGVSCENGSAQCPIPLTTAAGLVSDGASLWLFGGCVGTSPSNGTDCAGHLSNDLYRHDPAAHVWTKIAPAGGIKPPAVNTAFPWIFYDSTRARIVFYAGGSTLWQYSTLTNTWSQFAAAGTGPLFDAYLQNHSDGNAATYDPVADTAIFVYQRGQGVSPGLFELRFSGGS